MQTTATQVQVSAEAQNERLCSALRNGEDLMDLRMRWEKLVEDQIRQMVPPDFVEAELAFYQADSVEGRREIEIMKERGLNISQMEELICLHRNDRRARLGLAPLLEPWTKERITNYLQPRKNA